jgi:hypothetical protein
MMEGQAGLLLGKTVALTVLAVSVASVGAYRYTALWWSQHAA